MTEKQVVRMLVISLGKDSQKVQLQLVEPQ